MTPRSVCYLNGTWGPLERASISPLDRGFLFGDGVYEVVPVYAGRPFRLAAHLRRLADSLAATRIPDPLDLTGWSALIDKLCTENGGGDLSLYIQVTRGCPEQRRHEFPSRNAPTLFAMATPLPPAPDVETGLRARTAVDTRWARCDIKSVSLLPNILLRQAAVDSGADEAILHRDDWLTEGAASTLFVVSDGELATPALHPGLLPGVTREVIMELAARHHLPHQCRPIHLDELATAEEIWLTSSTKEVAAVVELDGKAIGGGVPGPVFRAMRGWFDALKREQ